MFKKIDLLFFSYVGLTSLVLLFSWNASGNSWTLVGTRGFIVLLAIGIIYLHTVIKSGFTNFLRNAYPIALSGYFYSETVYYNKFALANIDPYLIKLEHWLFGVQPSVTFAKHFSNKLFSELMYFGYFSFYLLILGFVVYVFVKLPKERSELLFKLAAAMLLFYLFFGLLPSAGPQFYFSSPEKDLPTAYIFDKVMHFIQENAEQPTAAFPSSHVGISLIIMSLLRKRANVFFNIALPFVIILIFSTVYIKAHYVVDVIGGFLFAPVILYISTALYCMPLYNKISQH